MTASFVHLHVHSEYSIVDSTVRIPALLEKCVSERMPAIALTDQNNMLGMVKFYRKAIAAGIKPVVGIDLRVANDDEPEHPFTLLLLVQDNAGYRNLSQLVTRCYLEGQIRGEPMANRAWLTADSCAGLIALSGGMQGDVGRALLKGDDAAARELLHGWSEIFRERYYLELIRTQRNGEEEVVQKSLALASENDIPVVATNDVRFLSRDGFNSHDARVCIHDGRGLAEADRPQNYSDDQFLRTAQEMVDLFADVPAAIQNTVEIAKRCNLDLRLGQSVLPEFPVPNGQSEAEFLDAEARRGMKEAVARKLVAEDVAQQQRDIVSVA